MRMIAPKVPEQIDQALLSFVRQLASESPKFISVKPWTKATATNCFINVRERVKEDGGSILYGWSLWATLPVFFEAIFHAVWESPSGDLVDITPEQHGEPKILFSQDRQREWTGSKVPNRRYPIVTTPHGIAAIRLMDRLSELVCKYDDGHFLVPESELLAAIDSSGLKREIGKMLILSTNLFPSHYKVASKK